MKILWLCNMIPGAIRQAMDSVNGDGLWVDHVLKDLLEVPEAELRVLCRGSRFASGSAGKNLTYAVFSGTYPGKDGNALEPFLERQLREFSPDVIHIWGTEYGHTPAMLRVCEKMGLTERTAVSLQGICSQIEKVYCGGLPANVLYPRTLRDVLKWDGILQQQRRFARQGVLETQALTVSKHVVGRTDWDRACLRLLPGERTYHHCDETLRDVFYTARWKEKGCVPHRIFAPSLLYPLKGFHVLLEALCVLLRDYPDAVLAVPGRSPYPGNARDRLLRDGYRVYLADYMEKHGLREHVEFLGNLSGEEMCVQMQKCSVFVSCSYLENSSNTLGEAMLLGMPCVASDVGGTSSMLKNEQEGLLYPAGDVPLLTMHIRRIWDTPSFGRALGENARCHARQTHNPEKNFRTLWGIYEELCREGKTHE